MISSNSVSVSHFPTNVEVQSLADSKPVEGAEDLPPANDVVEFQEAGAAGEIVVVTRTKLNESRRLIDIIV